MRILKENTSALMIDIQEKLFPHIHNHEQLEIDTLKLVKGLNALEVPIYITEQYTKGLGLTIESIREEMGDAYQSVEKTAFSCCDMPEYKTDLRNKGKKNVIIFGIESHVCVLQTTIDLIEKGYQPIIIENCVSSRNDNDKQVAIERMRQEGAYISTYESILFELTRYSGTAQFKAISKIIK